MTVINTNINSYAAQVSMKKTDRALATATERLSTGFKINNAGDDAAGLAISERMTAQIRGAQMAARHASDAIAMIQTAEGALTEVSNAMQRMRELSVQAQNQTYATEDLLMMDQEYQQLEAEVSRIVETTKWNTMALLSGAGPIATKQGTFIMQVGPDSGMTINVTIGSMSTKAGETLTDLNALHISVQANAATATSKIDDAFAKLNAKRATLGAQMNRLEFALNNIQSYGVNMTDSRSRIKDTDYAQTMAELARVNIVRQAGVAMLAQANVQPQAVLQLLQ